MDALQKLYDVLMTRKNIAPETSYVASLYHKGTGKIVNKLIEETVETASAAFDDNKNKLAVESADLIFHLMVLWAHKGITPQDVIDILDKRTGTSGHEEKANRQKTPD